MNLSSRSYNSEIDLPAVLALPSQAKIKKGKAMSGERKGSPLLSTLCHSHDFPGQLLQSITQLGRLAYNEGTIQASQEMRYPGKVPSIAAQYNTPGYLFQCSQPGRHHLLRFL